jgi:hypothetical protein
VEHCLTAVEKTLRWREEYGWYRFPQEDFTREIAAGKCYFLNKDKNGCPIMYWRWVMMCCGVKLCRIYSHWVEEAAEILFYLINTHLLEHAHTGQQGMMDHTTRNRRITPSASLCP